MATSTLSICPNSMPQNTHLSMQLTSSDIRVTKWPQKRPQQMRQVVSLPQNRWLSWLKRCLSLIWRSERNHRQIMSVKTQSTPWITSKTSPSLTSSSSTKSSRRSFFSKWIPNSCRSNHHLVRTCTKRTLIHSSANRPLSNEWQIKRAWSYKRPCIAGNSPNICTRLLPKPVT